MPTAGPVGATDPGRGVTLGRVETAFLVLIGASAQIVVFALIPLAWWLHAKNEGEARRARMAGNGRRPRTTLRPAPSRRSGVGRRRRSSPPGSEPAAGAAPSPEDAQAAELEPFLRWLGFRSLDRSPGRSVVVAMVFGGAGFFGSALVAGSAGWASSVNGLWPVVGMLVAAVLQTALSEELFFRGFLLRRLEELLQALVDTEPADRSPVHDLLARWLEKRRRVALTANVLQAIACGMLRLLAQLVLFARDPLSCTAAFFFGAGSACLAGWVKQETKSLLPSWAAHSVGNVAASVVLILT